MSETEKMQRLHLLAAQGGELSAENSGKLQSWYEMLDREESRINRRNRPIDTAALKKKVQKTTKQIVIVSNDVADLLKQNELLRQENQQLRQKLESRLAGQIA